MIDGWRVAGIHYHCTMAVLDDDALSLHDGGADRDDITVFVAVGFFRGS